MHFHWGIFEDPLIRWEFYLDKVTQPSQMFDYLEGVIDLINRTQFYRVSQTKDGYTLNSNINYITHIKDIYQKTGKIRAFQARGGFLLPSDLDRAETMVCYEDTDGLHEVWVHNLRDVMNKISDKTNKTLSSARPVNPLSIYFIPGNPSRSESSDALFISLYTDIWLPWVSDYNSDHMDELLSMPSFDDLFDNRPLAARHTPRLNEFIRNVLKFTEDYGEIKIEFSVFASSLYYPMIKPDGTIDLDVKPANGRPASMYWLEE